MADLVLATLNAKYPHASFGLRYLMANLPAAVAPRAVMREFDINQRPADVLEAILAHSPRVVGLGVYIWNAAESLRLAGDLKRVRPDVVLILGGPEVSYETDGQAIVGLADYVITGEADVALGRLCEAILGGRRPAGKVIAAELPEFEGSGFRVPGSAKTGRAPTGEALSLLTPEPRTLNPAVQLPYHLYTPGTSGGGWFTSRPRAGARSSASFACRPWTCRCGTRRSRSFWRRCGSCWIGGCGSSSLSTGRSI
jgi:radical SAM superfamily enzyme YgiQ (UPF0313 family)